MTLVTLQESLPIDSHIEGDMLVIDSITVKQLDDTEFLIEGYSDYTPLPHKLVFSEDVQAISILVPYLLQLKDGVPRV